MPSRSLLPDGLVRGTTVQVDRHGRPGWVHLAGPGPAGRPVGGGSWVAAVGVPTLGLAAAAGFGVDLGRLVLVAPPPPGEWATVVATLLDAFDVVVVRPPHRATGRPGAGWRCPPARRPGPGAGLGARAPGPERRAGPRPPTSPSPSRPPRGRASARATATCGPAGPRSRPPAGGATTAPAAPSCGSPAPAARSPAMAARPAARAGARAGSGTRSAGTPTGMSDVA